MAVRFEWLRHCAEIPILLLFYSFLITEPVTTNFVIYRTCYISLGYNISDCAKLGSKDADNATQELEKLVEPFANTLSMTQSLTTVILPALFCLFVGPWSDKHGRKPVLISTFAGYTISGILTIIIVVTPTLSPWYLLVAAIPGVLFGGFSPLLMATLSYLTDITTAEKRGMRLGIFEGVIALGMLLGNLSSSYIYQFGGYISVFIISTVCIFLACLYCIIVLEETVIYTADQDDTSIFSCTNVLEMVKATFKPRENYTRCILLLSMSMAIIYILGSTADGTVFFLFLREKLKWDLQKYTLFKTARESIWIVGTVLGLVILHKLLKFKEVSLLFIGFLTYFVSVILQGLATEDWYIYAAGAIRCIAGVVSPMCRSLISKLISNDENGKIFSLMVSLETLTLTFGSPVYTLLYNYTLNTNPGLFNFLTAGIFGIELILVITVIVIQKTILNVHNYTSLSVNADDSYLVH